MALKVFARRKEAHPPHPPPVGITGPTPQTDYQPAEVAQLHPDPLQRLLQQNRPAVIIADAQRWVSDARFDEARAQAERAIEEDFALVPAGCASVHTTLDDLPGAPDVEHQVEPFLLAIHPVTNARFQHFVDAGCYDDLDLWPEEIWPHLIELHDLTGKPGPRFWRGGRHDKLTADWPVVGISWYEADAYARWAGLRLPNEAEWQMAASWRIRSEADVFRRFPWGDAMDYQRCNIWGTGLGTISPVDTFENGAALNGVKQLIGNVWEWTSSDFEVTDANGVPVVGEMPMKVTRGGAYDTYFDTQATSTFRTAQLLLSRTHNTGLRCALDV
jgi:iron(II)-dependent oxidoreductase